MNSSCQLLIHDWMLISPSSIKSEQLPEQKSEVASFLETDRKREFQGKVFDALKKHIGTIPNDRALHFVTFGRWSMHDLIFYVLQQTGPAHLKIATWSIAEAAVRTLVRKVESGEILSCEFLIDPRVKVRNVKPLQMLQANFVHRFAACHAKVTTIENENWNISIVASANLTNNPRIERGVIFPFKDVFEFDNNWLNETIHGGRIEVD